MAGAWRAAALGAGATLLAGRLCWWLVDGVLQQWSGALTRVAVQESFSLLASGAAAALATWATLLLAGATLDLLGDALGRSGAARPGLRGRVAAGLLVAATLGGGPAGAAWAAPVPVVAAAHPSAPRPAPLVGPAAAAPCADASPDGAGDARDIPVPGWTPTPAPVAGRAARAGDTSSEVGLVSTAPSTARPAPVGGDGEVVVRAGDTLWDIAARALGERATDQDVAEAWPAWYAANRHTIGDDPDLLLPGQRLVAPSAGADR